MRWIGFPVRFVLGVLAFAFLGLSILVHEVLFPSDKYFWMPKMHRAAGQVALWIWQMEAQ